MLVNSPLRSLESPPMTVAPIQAAPHQFTKEFSSKRSIGFTKIARAEGNRLKVRQKNSHIIKYYDICNVNILCNNQYIDHFNIF